MCFGWTSRIAEIDASIARFSLDWRAWYEGSGDQRRFDPHVVSIDAIEPRSKGGQYIEGNIAFCCFACNALKAQHTVAHLQLFLHLIKNSEPSWSAGMMAAPQTPPSVPLGEQDRLFLQTWARREYTKYHAKAADKPRKAGDLSVDGIVHLVEKVYVPGGGVLC